MVDKSQSSLHLLVQSYTVNLAQYPAKTTISPDVFQVDLPFLTVTRTSEETTLLYGVKNDGKEPNMDEILASLGLPEPMNQDGPYAVLRVRGPLDLSENLFKSYLKNIG